MHKPRKTQLTIYLPEENRVQLQRLAAQRMVENPHKNFSAGSVAVALLVEYLNNLKTDNNINT